MDLWGMPLKAERIMLNREVMETIKRYLIYAIVCCGILVVMLLGGFKIESQQQSIRKLMSINNSLSYQYQSLQQEYDSKILAYQGECIRWQEVVKSCNNQIAWLESQPPKQVTTFVEKVNEVIKIPREFVSIEEAQSWLDNNHLPIVLVFNEDGELEFNNPQSDNRFNCNDYTQRLQRKAIADGFLVTYCLVLDGHVCGVHITDILGGHVGLLTRIQDSYYYIEATPETINSFKLVHIADAARS